MGTLTSASMERRDAAGWLRYPIMTLRPRTHTSLYATKGYIIPDNILYMIYPFAVVIVRTPRRPDRDRADAPGAARAQAAAALCVFCESNKTKSTRNQIYFKNNAFLPTEPSAVASGVTTEARERGPELAAGTHQPVKGIYYTLYYTTQYISLC